VVALLRTGIVLIATAAALFAAAQTGRADRPAQNVADLRALLVAAHVPLTRGSTATASSFPAAWSAFRRFVQEGKPEGLLFEFGVFESHFWGTSFEVVLVSGRVHFVVHFPVAAYVAITRDLRAMPCVPGAGCSFRCFFRGDDGLVPHPCRLAEAGYRIGDMRLSEFRSTPWIADVQSSPVFRALLARHVRTVGYELWAG
jgi:hypothetical protein